MKNNLEDYFEQHREALDADTPNGEMIWEGVQTQLMRGRYQRKLRLWQLAAAIALLLSAGYIGWDLRNEKLEKHASYNPDQASMAGPFASVENSYRAHLDELQRQVDARNIDREHYAIYFEELQSIEETEEDFKNDIPLVNNKQRLAMILVDTYEKKIRLLEKMLIEIERQERREKALETENL